MSDQEAVLPHPVRTEKDWQDLPRYAKWDEETRKAWDEINFAHMTGLISGIKLDVEKFPDREFWTISMWVHREKREKK